MKTFLSSQSLSRKQAEDLIDVFPKTRPPLSKKIQTIYEEHYKDNRNGKTAVSSVARKLDSWLYKKVASTHLISPNAATLELGAGTLNHLDFEIPNKSYDIVEPMKNLYFDSPKLSLVRNSYSDISDIPASQKYQRIISIAVLEHVTNLPQLIGRSCLLLSKNGIFSCGIPNEGKFLWELAWRLTTGLEFRVRYGAEYGELMRHEHVNNADEIEIILKYFFNKVSVQHFGLGKNLSLYRYMECSEPNEDHYKRFL
jgi:hypothetical protein